MNLTNALLVFAGVLATATIIGVLYRVRDGRLKSGSGTTLTAADVGIAQPFTSAVTLVQFSTKTCAKCPGARRILTNIAGANPTVSHVDVDLTDRPDIASRFSVLQTPTTLIVDRAGVIRARIGGIPRIDELSNEIETLLENTHVSAKPADRH